MSGLRTRPSAETFPLDDIVTWVRQGRIRVPEFQRGLRWTRRDVVALLDSIYQGFPIGNLLLWEKDAPAETLTLGGLRVEGPAGPAFYVVDGQQRITALAASLTHDGWGDPRFAVGFDLDSGSFTARPRFKASWIPAHVLYDGSALLAWFYDRPDLMEYFAAATGAAKTLRDLRISTYVVRSDDEEVLRTIFDRTNNAGKKLSRGEVFAALHRSGGAGAGTSPRAVAEDVEARTRFGTLDDGLVMRILLARRGPDVNREIRNEFDRGAKGRDAFATKEDATDAFRGAADAAVRAIVFLEEEANVPHQTFLANQYLLVSLARFLAHHSDPTPRHRRLLRRFVWRAAVIGPSLVPGNVTGVSAGINRAIDPDNELTSVQALMKMVDRPRPDYSPPDPFRTNTAASKRLLCAMWHHGPRGFADGASVNADDLRGALGDGPTAAGVVRPLVAASGGQSVPDAGNRLLVVPEADRESDVRAALQDVGRSVLSSHLLEPGDLERLDGGDVAAVLSERANRLAMMQEAFLDQMCEWEQDDSPDLAMLVAETGDVDAPT